MPCRLFYNGFFAASRHAVRQYRIRDVQDFCAKPVYVISHSRPVAPLAKIFFIIQEALAIVIDIYQFPGLLWKIFSVKLLLPGGFPHMRQKSGCRKTDSLKTDTE